VGKVGGGEDMTYRVVITDIKGLHKAMYIVANNLLNAGIIAEKQYEESLKKNINEKEGEQDV
jgi:hypothetical protein